MIKIDSHLHTKFSTDSDAEPYEYIKKAKKLGLESICFTDHNDFDFPLEDGKEVFLLDFKSYLDYMLNLREELRGKFDLRIGLEQGLMKSVAKRVDEFDKDKKLDFIIGSSHLVDGKDPYYESFWKDKEEKEVIRRYYETIIENIKSCNNFDVYGHLDYVIRYAPTKDKNYNWRDYYDYFHEILSLLINKGKGIEVNTAGLKAGLKNPNPSIDIVKMYKELGGEILTVGSDAHEPKYLSFEFKRVEEMLKAAGIKYYCGFRARKAEFFSM